MSKKMVLFLILVIETVIAYDFKCPARAEWRLRANVSCLAEYKYVCLFHLLEQKYQDNCLGSDRSSIGSSLVFQPLFNIAECNADRYQPSIFTTNGNSECILRKSKCDEEGQVVYSNGSSSSDTTCGCDYIRGFVFVSKPKNSCFCIPSEEDCTCFRVKCDKVSPDYQCIIEADMLTNTNCQEIHSSILQMQHNRTVQNIECQISKRYVHQVTYIILVIITVYIVIAVLIVFVEPFFSIKSDDETQFIHELLLKGECGKHHFARVILIGKNGVGKTSLMRRLLWQKVENVTPPCSTDGIEIERCNINVQSGIWSPCLKIDNDLTRLIRQVFTDEKMKEQRFVKQKTEVTDLIQAYRISDTHSSKNVETLEEDDVEISSLSSTIVSGSLEYDLLILEMLNETNDTKIDETPVIEAQKEKEDEPNQMQPADVAFEHSSTQPVDNENYLIETASEDSPAIDDKIDKMTCAIMQNNRPNKESKMLDILAFCWLWDFAGQKDFYATHQVFLSKCAVFLLVTDTLDFSTAERLWTDLEDSANYIRFWIDTIHCYCSTTGTEGRLDPPIIVVCTNEDRCKDELEQQKRQDNFKENLGRTLKGEKKKEHLRNIYFVSNTKDDDTVFETIRRDISSQAMNMKDWGRDCPLKWLLFQQVLGKLKEGDVPISTTSRLQKIAKHDGIGITNQEDFRLCLQYCHDIGTLIFFDEENLRDHVILDPKWLVDAFRCLVSDKYDSIIKISDDWIKLKDTGELTDSLVSMLFRKEPKLKFFENKAHLIEVMKRFDIIVNLKNSAALYMPCMMKSCSISQFQEQFVVGGKSFQRTSWLCFEFEFLPPSFFNHILAWYIKKYPVSVVSEKGTTNKRNALYRQIGIFHLDSSRCEQLVVCEGPNVIAIQVWDSRMSNKTYGCIGKNLVQCVEKLRKRYSLRISFTRSFKCQDGDFTKNRKNIKELFTTDYLCEEHDTNHLSDNLVKPWNFSEELEMLREEDLNRTSLMLGEDKMLRESVMLGEDKMLRESVRLKEEETKRLNMAAIKYEEWCNS